jgi:hypothetical protein
VGVTGGDRKIGAGLWKDKDTPRKENARDTAAWHWLWESGGL